MQIDTNILIAWGGVSKKYKKNATIFNEEDHPFFYYQIVEGQVKLVNLYNDGKEYIQGVFYDGNGFGEPPLFIDKPYPSSAIVQKDSVIIKLSKSSFFKMLEDNPKIQFELLKVLSQRIYNKSNTSRDLINNTPEERIFTFLQGLKKKNETQNECFLVPHTRQEIANLLGLRVETVIRTLKKMEVEKRVKIISHKLYF
jgi:CRP/FNR family transcriptional regulator